jgi:tRNA uridine 5-carbamoylmethylation protein Kti12
MRADVGGPSWHRRQDEGRKGEPGHRAGTYAHNAMATLPNVPQKPATEQNYLYELDKTTSDILAQILTYQRDHQGEGGGEIKVADVEKPIELPASPMTLPQLQRIRRQFIAMNRQHSLSKARVKEVFVDYLNSEFLR